MAGGGPDTPSLELEGEDLDAALARLEARTRAFLASRPTEAALFPPGATGPLDGLGVSEPPTSLARTIDEAFDLLTRNGITTTSGRFFGYIPGGGLPPAAFGDFIAALTNGYAGMYGASPGAVRVENACLAWLAETFALGPGAWGTFTSGGSLATVTALVVARDRIRPEQRADAVVYLTDQAHLCARKALRVVGMGHVDMRVIPTDDALRMVPDALESAVRDDRARGKRPWLLFASAGTTNTGAIDPLEALAAIAEREGLWFHVDGAYGGLFVLTDAGRARLRGIDRADSLVVDPHKALFQPYGLGACLVREGALLRASFAEDAAYLADAQDANVRSPSDYSPELTRHFRALRLWMSLRTHGVVRFRRALEEKLALAEALAERLASLDGVVVLELPSLTVVAFRREEGDTATRALLETVVTRGRVLVSSTVVRGVLYIRACVLSFRSHVEEVDALVEEVRLALGPR